MTGIFNWPHFRALAPEVHLVLVGTFLVRGAYFMVWPFLPVILFHKFQLSATLTGMMLTSATILGAAAGLLSGYYSDRLGRRPIILTGCILVAGAFFALAVADHSFIYLMATICVAVGNALIDPASQALIGDKIPDVKYRESAFYMRYFMINAGAASGALIGVWLGLSGNQSAFFVVSLVYTCYLFVVIVSLKADEIKEGHSDISSFVTNFYRISLDKRLQIILLSYIAIAFVYANFDTTLIQYLTYAKLPRLLEMVSTLVAVNAATVILGQFPILRILNFLLPRQRIVAGVVLMGVSQILFALIVPTNFMGLVVAAVIFSIGELVSLPTFGIEVDRSTPDNLRGTYFGVSNLYVVGIAAAPVLGGVCLDQLGRVPLFLGLALICVVVALSLGIRNQMMLYQVDGK